MSLSLTSPIAEDMTPLMIGFRSVSSKLSSILPASIFDRSRISLMRPSRCCPLLKIAVRSVSCISVRGPSIPLRMTREKPMIELSGVRSSWDILARNCVLSLSISRRRWAVSFCSSKARMLSIAMAAWRASVWQKSTSSSPNARCRFM